MPLQWGIRLSRAAEQDFNEIILWTAKQFGVYQAQLYQDIILDALQELQNDPTVIGSTNITGLSENLKALHVARNGKRGRHFIVFDLSQKDFIQVLRILHDSMDIERHLNNFPAS